MKKILIIENGLGFGGALTSLSTFLDEVSDQDWEFHLLTSYNQDYINKKGMVKFVGVVERDRRYGQASLIEKKLSVFLGCRAGNVSFVIDCLTTGRRYAHKIADYIVSNNIDLVHMNNGTLINDAAILGAEKAQIPIVVHTRAPEYCSRPTAWLANKVDHFFPISSFVQNSLLELGIPLNKQSIVPEGLDVVAFVKGADGASFKRDVNLPENRPIVGMIGCLVNWKGHKVFLDACARAFNEVDALAIIVGDTPDGSISFKKELEEYASWLNISEHVRFVGHRNDIPNVIKVCDLVVHASTSPEPFGRVLLEGMAMSKVVIATNCGGPAEIITDHVDGLLVPPNDSVAMSDAILSVLGNRILRDKLSMAGFNTVSKKYSIESHADKILTTYRCLIEQ